MVRCVLILGDEKGLQRVFGVPAIRRSALLALQLGIRTIHVITRDVSLFSVLSDLVDAEMFHVITQEPALLGTVTTLRLTESEQVLVLKANHVIDHWSLVRLLHDGASHPVCFLEKNGRMSGDAVFLVNASHLGSLVGGPAVPGCLPATDDATRTEGTPGLPEVLDGEQGKARLAEERLVAGLERATREHDSFLAHHVSRLISRMISPMVARTRMTPNMVTLFNTANGLLGALLLARGTYPSQVAGSLLFLLSVILDGVDGEVARLKLQSSTFGHYLDIISDNAVHVAIFVGMGFGLYRQTNNAAFLHVLWILLTGFGLCALAIHTIMTSVSGGGPGQSRMLNMLEAVFNNRDFAYLVAGLALFHCLDWFLPAAAVGTYLFACTLFILNFRLKHRGAVGSEVAD